MKKTARLFSVLLAAAACLPTICSMTAYAEDKAPVSVSIAADKDAYEKGDSLKFNVSVSNDSAAEIGDISLKASLPDKFKISENEAYTVKLGANETKSYVIAADPAAEESAETTAASESTTSAESTRATTGSKKNAAATKTDAPKSTDNSGKTEGPKAGDAAPVFLMIVCGGALIAAAKSRKSRKVFTLMITSVLFGSFAMYHFDSFAEEAAKQQEVTATAEFKYDGADETITLTAAYELKSGQVLDYNKQALRDVTGVSNARQLGGYINTEGKKIKQNVLLRTANLAHITDAGIKALQEKYKVSDIMDFRYDRELNPNTTDKEIEGINHHNIPMAPTKATAAEVFSKNPELREKLQELQKNAGKPGGSMALSIFQAEVGVINAKKAIEYFESEEAIGYYRDAFKIFLNKPEDAAILWHCAGGKDRTGMVSMLMLSALDFDKDIIMQDYLMSNTANADKIAETKAAAEAYTDDEELRYNIIYTAAVYPEIMETNISDLERDYGSVKNFLREKVGLTDDDFAKLKALYLED